MRTLGIAALLAIAAAGTLPASTIDVTALDTTRGMNNVWLKADGAEVREYYVGAITIVVDSYTRTAFCIDLFTGIGFGRYDSILSTPGNDARLGRIGWLIENVLPTVNTATAGAGLQVAIWDIIHDGGDGLNGGRIQRSVTNATTPAVVTAAAQYLTQSSGLSSTRAIVYSNSRNGVPAQRLVSDYALDGGPLPAPEGGTLTMVLTGLGLVLAGCLRSRRSWAALPCRASNVRNAGRRQM